jgi:hypothetical protein
MREANRDFWRDVEVPARSPLGLLALWVGLAGMLRVLGQSRRGGRTSARDRLTVFQREDFQGDLHVAFVPPLIAQSMDSASLSAPLGLPNVTLGLVVGVFLRMIAKLRGRWV